MSTWFQEFPFSSGDTAAWLRLTPENSFRVMTAAQLPGPLPPALLSMCDHALVMRSGSAAQEYVVANLYRRDNGEIDQMPFGSVFYSGSGCGGLLTHHGDWIDRTSPAYSSPPTGYSLSVTSGTAYTVAFATKVLPTVESGSIFDLRPNTNLEAFGRVVDEIQRRSLPAGPAPSL